MPSTKKANIRAMSIHSSRIICFIGLQGDALSSLLLKQKENQRKKAKKFKQWGSFVGLAVFGIACENLLQDCALQDFSRCFTMFCILSQKN